MVNKRFLLIISLVLLLLLSNNTSIIISGKTISSENCNISNNNSIKNYTKFENIKKIGTNVNINASTNQEDHNLILPGEIFYEFTPPYDDEYDDGGTHAWVYADKETGDLDGFAGAEGYDIFSSGQGYLAESWSTISVDSHFVKKTRIHVDFYGHIGGNLYWVDGHCEIKIFYRFFKNGEHLFNGLMIHKYVDAESDYFWEVDEDYIFEHDLHDFSQYFEQGDSGEIQFVGYICADKGDSPSDGLCSATFDLTLEKIEIMGDYLPDLTFGEMTFERYSKDIFEMNVEIKNIGNGPIQGTHGFDVDFYFDGQQVDRNHIEQILPGDSVFTCYRPTWPYDFNQHTIKVVIDRDDDVLETNEENNEKTWGKGSCCFPAGTEITLWSGGVKTIENIEVGDVVKSYNPDLDIFLPWMVAYLGGVQEVLYGINDGLIQTTDDHPFYIKKADETQGWGAIFPESAEEHTRIIGNILPIEVGDHLFNSDKQWIEITSITLLPETHTTYNILSLSGVRTYFANDVLVFEEFGPWWEYDDPPIAIFEWYDEDTSGPGTSIAFDASDSYDRFEITQYEWDWTNDGSYDFTDDDPYCTHEYGDAYPHECKLRVTDDAEQTDTVVIEVQAESDYIPYKPCNPYPEDGMIDVDLPIVLSWEGGDPEPDDDVIYTIYFGIEQDPPYYDTIVRPATETQVLYDPGSLEYATMYYWKIKADDGIGIKTSAIWSFQTIDGPLNDPPFTPTNPSPEDGATGVDLNPLLSVYVSDPDGDMMDVAFLKQNADIQTLHIIEEDFSSWGNSKIFAKDIDNDNDIDVVGTSEASREVAWWENNRDGTYTKHLIDDDFYGNYKISAIDIDDDTDVDIIACSNLDELVWWENNGDEVFTKHQICDLVGGVYDFHPIDLDEDNDLDIIAAHYDGYYWWENNGEEIFTEHLIDDSSSGWNCYPSDIDSDGDIDISLAYLYETDIAWLENNGEEQFTKNIIDTKAEFDIDYDTTCVDLDGDGDVDIIHTISGDSENGIFWWENNGNEVFTKHVITDNPMISLCGVDLDYDEDIDIVTSMAWLENDGNEVFTEHEIASSGDSAQSIDFDNDGDIDYLRGRTDIEWWENTQSIGLDTDVPSGAYASVIWTDLSPSSTYSWKAIAEDTSNLISISPLWQFTTIAYPPLTPPQPSGPTEGLIYESYEYYTSTDDPDGQQIKYGWDWNGDFIVDEWTDWYESGQLCTISHSWTEPSTYEIRVKAKDIGEEVSDWSEPLIVIIENEPPYNPTNPNPVNQSFDELLDIILQWDGGDSQELDEVYYDIYLGPSSDPEFITTIGPHPATQTQMIYNPGYLEPETLYYWKIIAYDNHGSFALGPTWQFTTGDDSAFTHTVLAEYATSTDCVYCPQVVGYLDTIYSSGSYNFYYVTLVNDQNPYASNRIDELNPFGFPTVFYDGGYDHVIGGAGGTSPHIEAINESGIREVADINLIADVSWDEDAIIGINLDVINNEETQYNGFVRAYITEINSRWSVYDEQYHFAMIGDYAINQGISIPAQDNVQIQTSWDGISQGFGDIQQSNILVIISVFQSSTEFTDDTVALIPEINHAPYQPHSPYPQDGSINIPLDITLDWQGGDPDPDDLVTYDVYFGTNPTPDEDELVSTGQNETFYSTSTLDYASTYYWQIVAMDNHGEIIIGPTWEFTTITEGFYLNLADFPMYQADIPHHDKCGAAVAQMTLNYIWWNQSQYPEEPPQLFDQTWLYERGLENNTDQTIPYLDTQGLWALLQGEKPGPYSEYGYNFMKYNHEDVTEVLKRVCLYINYTIGTYGGYKSGHPSHVPALVPTYGDYSNWMAIRGIHTDQEAYPLQDDLTIYGFWVNDPLPGGIGENSYKTISQWLDIYYHPVTSNDQYNGKYVTILEPPESDGKYNIVVAQELPRFKAYQQYIINKVNSQQLKVPTYVQKNIESWIIQAATKGVTDELAKIDEDFSEIFSTLSPATPYFVTNEYSENYYLVPYSSQDGVQCIVIINAVDGQFLEATWTSNPFIYLPVSKEQAITLLKKYCEEQGLDINQEQFTTRLVYQQANPYYPYWEINHEYLIDQKGEIKER